MAILSMSFGIMVAIAIGAISPGPSFVLVSRISLSNSRRHELAAVIGALGLRLIGESLAALRR